MYCVMDLVCVSECMIRFLSQFVFSLYIYVCLYFLLETSFPLISISISYYLVSGVAERPLLHLTQARISQIGIGQVDQYKLY